MRRAAELVGADAFISKLPDGYGQDVRERGASLSHGQRQLLSFVRALVYDPEFLVLDEATSSVDTETERLIEQALEKLMGGPYVPCGRASPVHDPALRSYSCHAQGPHPRAGRPPGIAGDGRAVPPVVRIAVRRTGGAASRLTGLYVTVSSFSIRCFPRHSPDIPHVMTAYYESHHLSRFGDIGKGNKELADLFFAWYGKVFEEGALTVREKGADRAGRGSYRTVPLLY